MRRVMYAMDEPLIVLPLDKTGRGVSKSCVVLRARGVHRELKRRDSVLAIHHEYLTPLSVVGMLLNFGELYEQYRTVVPFKPKRSEEAKLWKQHRVCFITGDDLETLQTYGTLKWKAATFYHYDSADLRETLMVRIGIGRGKVWSSDATPYYARDFLQKMTYQFLEGLLNEETRKRA